MLTYTGVQVIGIFPVQNSRTKCSTNQLTTIRHPWPDFQIQDECRKFDRLVEWAKFYFRQNSNGYDKDETCVCC